MTVIDEGPSVPPRCDVVVVGAGLAGLAAARTLWGNGLDVLVIEAGDAVGGRVRSDVVDGWTVDRGFQLLNPAYPALRRFLDVEALRLQSLGTGVVTAVVQGSVTDRVHLPDPRRSPVAAARAAVRLSGPGELLALVRYLARVRALPVARLESAPDLGWHAALDAAGLAGGLRRSVLEPFLTGVLGDGDGVTSRRYVDLVLRSFVQAALTVAPGVPVGGIRMVAEAVAGPVRSLVRTGVAVQDLSRTGGGWLLRTTAGEVVARAVVVAGEATATARLLGRAAPATHALTTFWHVTDVPPVTGPRSRYLHVSGSGEHRHRGGLLNTVVMSAAAPSYRAPGAPTGAELVATTVLGVAGDAEARARRAAGTVLGAEPGRWSVLAVHEIRHALPAAPPPLDVRAPVDLGEGLVVAGDHRDTPSSQGALVSGRRAAHAALAHVLGRQDVPAPHDAAAHDAAPDPVRRDPEPARAR